MHAGSHDQKEPGRTPAGRVYEMAQGLDSGSAFWIRFQPDRRSFFNQLHGKTALKARWLAGNAKRRKARRTLGRGERIQCQIIHSEILGAVRKERKIMGDRNRGHGCVRDAHHDSLFAMITFQNAGKARDRPSNVVVLQTTKKFFSGFLFFGLHACVHFRDIDRTASQKMPCSEDPTKNHAGHACC